MQDIEHYEPRTFHDHQLQFDYDEVIRLAEQGGYKKTAKFIRLCQDYRHWEHIISNPKLFWFAVDYVCEAEHEDQEMVLDDGLWTLRDFILTFALI